MYTENIFYLFHIPLNSVQYFFHTIFVGKKLFIVVVFIYYLYFVLRRPRSFHFIAAQKHGMMKGKKRNTKIYPIKVGFTFKSHEFHIKLLANCNFNLFVKFRPYFAGYFDNFQHNFLFFIWFEIFCLHTHSLDFSF